MALAGFWFYALLRHEDISAGMALAFGALLEISAGMMLAAMLETINYLSLFWLPLNLLLWDRVAKSRGRAALAWTLAQGLAFYAMMMTDLQLILFLAFLLIPYGVLTLIEQGDWTARLRLMGRGLVALAIMTGLLWFVGPLSYILRYDFSELSPMAIENAGGIPFPLGYIWRYDTYNRAVTLGSLVLPLLIAAWIGRHRAHDRKRWFWLALAILPFLLSLGPFVHLGDTLIPMPYILLHRLFGGLFRSPARFDAVIIMAVLLFVGRTFTPLIKRAHASLGVAVGGLLLVVIDARLFVPMPIQPVAPHYTFYETIGKERGEPYDREVILEVPVAGGSGEAWVGEFRAMETQFYGMIHGKRMLNGAIARAPLRYFWYWLYDDPMLSWLGQRRYLEPQNVEAQLRQRIFDWQIGYVVVHRELIGHDSSTVQEILGYFNALDDLLCPYTVEGDAVVYRTRWHPDGCPQRTPPETLPGVYTLDIGSPGDEGFLGWGWHYPEPVSGLTLRWTGEYPQANIYLDLPPGAYTVDVSAQAFWEARRLRLWANGQILGDPVTVSVDALHEYRFVIPSPLLGDGKHVTLMLEYDAVVIPAQAEQSGDTRKLAIAVDWIRFTPFEMICTTCAASAILTPSSASRR